MVDIEILTTQLLELPADKRAKSAEILIQSLGEVEDADVKTAWLREIKRRDHEIRTGKPVTKSADGVLKQARAQL